MLSTIDIGPGLKRSDILADDPEVVRVTEFDLDTADAVADGIARAVTAGQDIVPIVINSYGGSVYAMLAMVDAIKASPIPVATVVVGKAWSCGAFLLSQGTPGRRYVAPRAGIMIHRVSWVTEQESLGGLRADADEGARLDRDALDMLDAAAKRPAGFFRDKLREREGSDWYLTPPEAVRLGLADRIYLPTLVTRVRATTELA